MGAKFTSGTVYNIMGVDTSVGEDMTEQEWLTSNDPAAMLIALQISNSLKNDHGQLQFKTSDRKLRLFACACVRQVWHLLTDDASCPVAHNVFDEDKRGVAQSLIKHWHQSCETCSGTGRINRSRRAVEVAERYADSEATENELEAAEEEARRGWETSDNPAGAARYCCIQGAYHAAQSITRPHMRDLPSQAIQASLLREIIGNPFRKLVVLPRDISVVLDHLRAGDKPRMEQEQVLPQACLTPTVLSLAKAAYEERPGRVCEFCKDHEPQLDFSLSPAMAKAIVQEARCQCACRGTGRIADGSLDPDRLAVLGDALEEAGCNNEVILNHLRGLEPCPTCTPAAVDLYDCPHCQGTLTRPSLHVRGCWILGLVLGKT